MSIPPAAEPTRAKVPQGDMATLVTFEPSPVSKIHRPALFLPQNQVLATLSFSWPVTTLSHPVVLLVVASFALLTFPAGVQICFSPGMAPIPPSRFIEHAMQIIRGALRSSSEGMPSEGRFAFKVPIFFFVFFRM